MHVLHGFREAGCAALFRPRSAVASHPCPSTQVPDTVPCQTTHSVHTFPQNIAGRASTRRVDCRIISCDAMRDGGPTAPSHHCRKRRRARAPALCPEEVLCTMRSGPPQRPSRRGNTSSKWCMSLDARSGPCACGTTSPCNYTSLNLLEFVVSLDWRRGESIGVAEARLLSRA